MSDLNTLNTKEIILQLNGQEETDEYIGNMYLSFQDYIDDGVDRSFLDLSIHPKNSKETFGMDGINLASLKQIRDFLAYVLEGK